MAEENKTQFSCSGPAFQADGQWRQPAPPPPGNLKLSAALPSHALLDQRALAMHRLIAEKLRRDPSLLAVAQANIARWKSTASPSALARLEEWEAILRQPLESILEVLTSESEEATRLRQSSPFCGILTPAERTHILLSHRP